MGASGSLFTATIVSADCMPAVWWIAAGTPTPVYRCREIAPPVCAISDVSDPALVGRQADGARGFTDLVDQLLDEGEM
jgi:hypothetical protein